MTIELATGGQICIVRESPKESNAEQGSQSASPIDQSGIISNTSDNESKFKSGTGLVITKWLHECNVNLSCRFQL